MSIDNLIVSTVNQSFSKYFYNELVIGRLAHTELKTGSGKGDEVDVIMPASVTLFGYVGGDLPEAEKPNKSSAKVKLDKGYAVHFVVDAIKKEQIQNAKTTEVKIELAKEYGVDSAKQASACVDKAYGGLYTRAGHYLSDNGGAIVLDSTIAKEILAYMKAEMQRGDKKGHTNWIDGQMTAIVPPEFEYHLGLSNTWDFTESGQSKVAKGFVGQLYGWDILVSNNIAQPDVDVFMPLFGHKGKTLAGGVCKDLSLMSYVPEKSFDTAYKGYGYFGVGAPRSDLLGCAKISCPLKLSISA